MFDPKLVGRLARFMVSSELTELELESEGQRIRLLRHAGASASVAESDVVEIRAPLSGVFHPAVQVGAVVESETVLCTIQTPEQVSELPAETAGRVKEVCAEAGSEVKKGQALFRIQRE